MRETAKSIFTVILALSLLTSPVLATGASSPAVNFAFIGSLGTPDAPNDVIEYGDTDPRPGVLVTVSSSDDVDALIQWANSSGDRTVIQRIDSTNTVLVSVHPEDVKRPLTDPIGRFFGESTLTDLEYVESWSWDREVEFANPIDNLESNDTFEKPTGAWWAETTTDGKFDASSMAWDSDAPAINMTDARKLVGTTKVSQTGAGINVAVIDSGVNFGNGQLYGNGTDGSDMRVVDAHDFVEGETADLTVDRSNLSDELAKVEDPNGHGSWVSSAVLNAKTGIAPEANLMAYRALNSDGSGSTSDIRAAIARSNEQRADIIVMSLGSPLWSQGMADELKHALSDEGNVTGAFVAVGNSYTTTRYVSSPADVEGIIGVSATNGVVPNKAKKAYFANTGPDTGFDGSNGKTHGIRPDTSAPGMNISTPVFTTDGGYVEETLSGTSMAAPIAAGVGALLLESEPTLKGQPDEFRDRLVESGSHTPNIGKTESLGGMVNATRAINGVETPATDRELPDKTKGRDAANRALAADTGVKMAEISEIVSNAKGLTNGLI